ncbi:MarR family transcriptional regulator [Alteromonas gilva]|uniref:MarR family transcriptional regulator n=1 Tax=Alteromonas gilva TaxID=2987522 RepID=A0ABT5L4X0_9ALTE|nr:MarR family transcriptional regulator [Alteromonas gilva]MDC8830813.1 MarR family transcriptional regulator [Alteromonas gilva]
MESNIGWMLSRAAFSWRHAVEYYMADLGLTQTRWIAMLHLDRLGEGCTQKELAAHIDIEQPSLLRTLNQLEEAGLIERKHCSEDARRRLLWFTDKGRSLLTDVEAKAKLGRQQMLQGLTSEQRQQLSSLLETVIDNAHHLITERQ